MTINISDVAITIGQQSNSINWWEFFKVLIPVFIGGFITYGVTMKTKIEDLRQKNIQKFVLIQQTASFCFNEINKLKISTITPIRRKLDNKELISLNDILGIYMPKVDFNIEVEDFIFLGSLNIYLPDLLNKTNVMFQIFKKTIETNDTFEELELKLKYLDEKNYLFNADKYITTFNNLETVIDGLLVYLYLILKNFNTCYAKYYNINYFDNIKESFESLRLEEHPTIAKYLKEDEYRNYQKSIDNNWIDQPRLFYTLCYLGRKFKHFSRGLKEFFLMPKGYSLLKNNKENDQANESGNS